MRWDRIKLLLESMEEDLLKQGFVLKSSCVNEYKCVNFQQLIYVYIIKIFSWRGNKFNDINL